MSLFVDDHDFKLYLGNIEEELLNLADGSIHCVVTSPPYYALRDYGTGVWEGGDPEHEHVANGNRNTDHPSLGGGRAHVPGAPHRKGAGSAHRCDCGATRQDDQVGLEPTLGGYIERMVGIFREVRRVLRDDGTAWLNLGDTFASTGGHGASDAVSTAFERRRDRRPENGYYSTVQGSLKAKDKMLVPHRVAIALQDDGWWVRQDNVWWKPNTMPESADDRTTNAHEYVFHLTKSGKPLFWTHPERPGTRTKPKADYRWLDRLDEGRTPMRAVPADPKELLDDGTKRWRRVNLWESHDYFYDGDAIKEDATWERWGAQTTTKYTSKESGSKAEMVMRRTKKEIGEDFDTSKKNARSVWAINTVPFPDAHFAVFPPELPTKCILAGTSAKGCCPTCGAPWARLTERVETGHDGSTYGERAVEATGGAIGGGTAASTLGSSNGAGVAQTRTLGWARTCDHEHAELELVPARVLDIFMGSGTTARTARGLGRHSVGVELSLKYAGMIKAEMAQLGLFT